MLAPPLINRALVTPWLTIISGVWHRAIELQHTATALQYQHTTRASSRFGAGSPLQPAHPLLYLAENQQVALLEVQAVLGAPGSGVMVANPQAAWAVLNITVKLREVVDLTDPQAQAALQTNPQELTGDWIGYQLRAARGATVTAPTGNAPTQELGAALYRVPGLQGLLTISAKAPDRKSLIIFPDKLAAPMDKIEFTGPGTKQTHRIP